MKVYGVYYYDAYDAMEFICVFSTEDKAKAFIEACKKPFYKDKVLYDYRGYDLCWSDWDLDEFENITIKTK